MTRPVRVVPYDPAWPQRFAQEAEVLTRSLQPPDFTVHHIGGTSVPGLCAKPVIDILVQAPSVRAVDVATRRLEEVGYEARGEYGIPGRRYLVRRPVSGPSVHVHCFARGSDRILRHLRLRDYLRAHPARAAEYGALKRTLAAEHAHDRDAYQQGKAEPTELLHRRALEWVEAAHP